MLPGRNGHRASMSLFHPGLCNLCKGMCKSLKPNGLFCGELPWTLQWTCCKGSESTAVLRSTKKASAFCNQALAWRTWCGYARIILISHKSPFQMSVMTPMGKIRPLILMTWSRMPMGCKSRSNSRLRRMPLLEVRSGSLAAKGGRCLVGSSVQLCRTSAARVAGCTFGYLMLTTKIMWLRAICKSGCGWTMWTSMSPSCPTSCHNWCSSCIIVLASWANVKTSRLPNSTTPTPKVTSKMDDCSFHCRIVSNCCWISAVTS